MLVGSFFVNEYASGHVYCPWDHKGNSWGILFISIITISRYDFESTDLLNTKFTDSKYANKPLNCAFEDASG